MSSTLRFLREFLAPRQRAVVEEETVYERGGQTLPATVYRPRAARTPLPGWMTLHGITYHGRHHESLRRLARALAASGTVVLVPDIPEWRALHVAPRTTVDTIRAAVLALDARGLTEPGRIGVLGFSFGATQALIAACDPALHGRIAGVAAWGGYADMLRVTRFMFLGDHELDGEAHHREPDPYGRWILAGNYLTLLPEHRGDAALADALLALARHAGRHGLRAWDPAMDGRAADLRGTLSTDQREVYGLLAAPAGTRLSAEERTRVGTLVDRMVAAALETEPLLDPGPWLPRVTVPVFLAHGRDDRLIPWTEMVRLRRALPPGRLAGGGITSLFSHSFGQRRFPSPRTVVEAVRFVGLLRQLVGLV